jgi:cyclopropane fatty-acyl-phospholipid synthase-like methyltransferase
MDRPTWLKEKRRLAEERMDTLFAPIYDQNWGATIDPAHQIFIAKFLSLCPPQARILDAACGTGKYWPAILAAGRTVLGTEQSQGMLDRARQKFPDTPVEKVGLQEMSYQEAFDGTICMDAMEFVFPEDWPLVLGNFYRAIKPNGYFYFTVEIAAEEETRAAYEAGQSLGLPVVYGEWGHEGGYHYYPTMTQVKAWLEQARFDLVDETEEDVYHHFIVRKQ